MGIFSSKSSKPAGGKTRRSSASRNVSLLKKLRKELAAVGRLDRRIAILDKKISDIPKEPFTRAKKELLTAQRLNLVGQRDELLVKVDAYKATIQQSNQKNLTIAQSKFNGRGK